VRDKKVGGDFSSEMTVSLLFEATADRDFSGV
jgi:hypothetical protein